MEALKPYDLYSQLEQLPDSLTGEILNGRLHAHPRPGGKHVLAATTLGLEIGGPYFRGRGGPGGWWILVEPEVHFVPDREVAVPDVAGWLKTRMPEVPEEHKFTVIPDWVCEIMSPSTESIDREIKMPLYAGYGVQWCWLVNPLKQEMETYKLEKGQWILTGEYSFVDEVSAEPFTVLKLTLGELLG